MNEAELRDVLFVRAVEEVDGGGRLIGLRERERATREARAGAAPGEAQGDERPFLVARARLLRARLAAEVSGLTGVLDLSGRARFPAWTVFGLCFVAGLVVDRFGDGRRVDVLSFPLLGLVAWNLAVYALLAAAALLGRRRARAQRRPCAGWPARLALWAVAPERPWTRLRHAKDAGLVAAVLQRYFGDWARAAAPLHRARARRAFHFGAAGLVLGAVAGMYLRGLVLEYEASWESTFLEAEQVHALLSVFLGPAAWALGRPLPGVEALRAIQGAENAANAAGWIHLYGATAFGLVVAPRLVLGWLAGRRARRLALDLPVRFDDDPWALRLCAGERGGGTVAELVPYSFRLSPRAAQELSGLLYDLLGNRARIDLREPLEYGAEALPDGAPEACRVIVFNLGQSPEQEVHGEFLERQKQAARRAGGRRSLLVVVDRSPYRARLGIAEDPEQRVVERQRSWERVFRECGLEALFLDLDRRAGPDAGVDLCAARGALWPAAPREEAG